MLGVQIKDPLIGVAVVLIPGFFGHFEKKLQAKKTQAEKIKQIFQKTQANKSKLNILPSRINFFFSKSS